MGVAVMGEFFIDMSLIHKEGSPEEERDSRVFSADPDICISDAWEVCTSQWQLSQYDFSRIRESGDSHLTCSHYSLSPFISFWPSGCRSGVIIIIMWFLKTLHRQMCHCILVSRGTKCNPAVETTFACTVNLNISNSKCHPFLKKQDSQ